jgi:thiamine-phosphate pyrophosphorylase
LKETSEDWRKLLRAIDANSNRISEGLRVVEEVARFVLDDAELTERLKATRHFVRHTAQELGGSVSALLEARESDGDVGKPLSTADSSDRKGVVGVVSANMRRAEEGLRVLEELSASIDLEISNRVKQCRFGLYSIEKEIVRRLEGRSQA